MGERSRGVGPCLAGICVAKVTAGGLCTLKDQHGELKSTLKDPNTKGRGSIYTIYFLIKGAFITLGFSWITRSLKLLGRREERKHASEKGKGALIYNEKAWWSKLMQKVTIVSILSCFHSHYVHIYTYLPKNANCKVKVHMGHLIYAFISPFIKVWGVWWTSNKGV